MIINRLFTFSSYMNHDNSIMIQMNKLTFRTGNLSVVLNLDVEGWLLEKEKRTKN